MPPRRQRRRNGTWRELQAIEQPNAAILDANARSVQVTMAIANATLDHPPVQQRRSFIQELLDVSADVLVNLVRDGLADERRHLVEVFVPVARDRRAGAVLIDAGASSRGRVEASQRASNPASQTAIHVAARQKVWQHALLGQTPHPHGRLTGAAGATDAKSAAIQSDLDNAEVHVRAEAPIQA
jgi:hypothetical protein